MKPKITKSQLEVENSILKEKIEEWKGSDEIIRRNISGFLGSYEKEGSYYGSELKVKVLPWSSIYFRLGKVFAEKERLDSIADMLSRLDSLEQRMSEHCKRRTRRCR